MQYTNPELPEGINTSDSHPLKEFFILSIGVIGLVFITISLLIVIVDNFADKIPFEAEKHLPVNKFLTDKAQKNLPPYLQSISEKIIKNADLPEDMDITMHYVNSDTVNAFATLGGHIVLYRGLLEKLKTEEELAMLMAHEIAHIKYRHPILSTSHGIVVGLALTLISTSAGSMATDLLGTTSSLTLMSYSRDYEYQSDKDAINTLIKTYGNANGAIGLFNILAKENSKAEPIELFNTHPLTENRISQTHHLAEQAGSSQELPQPILIPDTFKNWLAQQKQLAKEAKTKDLPKEPN